MQLVQRQEVEIIDKLISVGIDARDVKRLLDAGISTCNDLLMHTKKSLTGIKGLSKTKVDKICKAVDKIVIPMKGKNGKAAYINTEGTFRPDLVVLINEKFGMDATAVLDNARGYTSEQMKLVKGDKVPDEESDVSETIDKLISMGIDARDVKKLLDAGISTCNDLLMHTKKSLTGIKGLCETKVDKICKAVDKIVNNGYITGADALLKRNVDELLFFESKDGAETSEIGMAAYINTDGTFRPDLVVLISEKLGMDATAVLDNIIQAHAYTNEHQDNPFFGLTTKMAKEPLRLSIVDSLIPLFGIDFSGMGEQQVIPSMSFRNNQGGGGSGGGGGVGGGDGGGGDGGGGGGGGGGDDVDIAVVGDNFGGDVDDGITIDLEVFIEQAHEDVLAGRLDFLECLNFHSIEELKAKVVEGVRNHPSLPKPYYIYPQSHLSRVSRFHVDLPTTYDHLIRRVDRILVATRQPF